jgi:uncharacterized membrane protein YccC
MIAVFTSFIDLIAAIVTGLLRLIGTIIGSVVGLVITVLIVAALILFGLFHLL